MKYISLLLTCLLLASCSSDSNSSGSGVNNNPALQPETTPQSLIARAWEAKDESSNYTYRVELLKDGKILAHVSQIKASPVLIKNKKNEFVVKLDANGYSTSHLSLWRETIDSRITIPELANGRTLGKDFYKSLDFHSIKESAEEIISEKLKLKLVGESLITYKPVIGSFKMQEKQWVFSPNQPLDISVSYEKTSPIDYKVNLKYSKEEPNLFVRSVFYSRTKKDSSAKEWYSRVDSIESFNKISSRMRNGYVTEIQIYKQIKDEYIPQTNVIAYYLPAFQLDQNTIQWDLDLNPTGLGWYSGAIRVTLPFDIEPYSYPKLGGKEELLGKQSAYVGSMNFYEQYIDNRTMSYEFSDMAQTSKVEFYLFLNDHSHRYFEPEFVTYQIAQVPSYYLELKDLKFDCVKEGMSFKVSWKSPGAFEMKGEATSITSHEKFITQYSTKKELHEIYVPANIDGYMSTIKISYKDPYTNEEEKISDEKFVSSVCPEVQ